MCGVFDSWDGVVDITTDEAKRIQALSKKLNDGLKALVEEMNQTNSEYNASHPASPREFRYVFVDGIKERFAEHGYCAPQPLFVGAGQSYREQGDSRGLLHPNEAGNRAMAAAIAEKILEVIERDPALGHLR
jgi:lysophospholipase L1-like esterase